MKKRIISLTLLLCITLLLVSCSVSEKNSSFRIIFIDVGQGDAALIQCDGYNMLIDAGPKGAGKAVVNVLKNQKVQRLHILVASHMHDDHIGGMTEILEYLDLNEKGRDISYVLTNTTHAHTDAGKDFITELSRLGISFKVPSVGSSFKLGSATINVLDVSSAEDNDSLVLLITYKSTRYLFTGDIERSGQQRVISALKADKKHAYPESDNWTTLIKMPHHGAYNDLQGTNNNAMYPLLDEYYPSYIIISVGTDNKYGHPHQLTLESINNLIVRSKKLDWDSHVFRTDKYGSIMVKVLPDGKTLDISQYP